LAATSRKALSAASSALAVIFEPMAMNFSLKKALSPSRLSGSFLTCSAVGAGLGFVSWAIAGTAIIPANAAREKAIERIVGNPVRRKDPRPTDTNRQAGTGRAGTPPLEPINSRHASKIRPIHQSTS